MGRKNIYPESVQPGIPRLGQSPKGWKTIAFGKVLRAVSRPANLVNNLQYNLVTAKRARGGIILRGTKSGQDIKTKTQFYVKDGDFLISRRQIVHGGCGVVPSHLDNAVVSNEYLILHPEAGLRPDFLRWLSHSIYFQQTCFHASIGVHVEKMVFAPEKWFRFQFHLPPREGAEKNRNAVILLGRSHFESGESD